MRVALSAQGDPVNHPPTMPPPPPGTPLESQAPLELDLEEEGTLSPSPEPPFSKEKDLHVIQRVPWKAVGLGGALLASLGLCLFFLLSDPMPTSVAPSHSPASIEKLTGKTSQTLPEDPTTHVPHFPPAPAGLSLYSSLPNPLPTGVPKPQAWTPLERVSAENAWREPQVWHQMEVLASLRKNPRMGSEAILWKGTQHGKFWVRMLALLARGERALPIPTEAFAYVLRDVPTPLLMSYMKRFSETSTPGERYILRGILPFVEPPVRQQILQTLRQSLPEEHRDAYEKAALQDPNPLVREVGKK